MNDQSDPAVEASAARRLATDLPRGTGKPVAGRHCCFIEHSRAVTERLLAHIEEYGEKRA
jgi:hypothetical protein